MRDNLVRTASTHRHPPPLLATAVTLLGACLALLATSSSCAAASSASASGRSFRPFLWAGLTLGVAYAFSSRASHTGA